MGWFNERQWCSYDKRLYEDSRSQSVGKDENKGI